MEQHKWTESGLNLLNLFNYEIQRLGGIKTTYMMIKIESEINNTTIKRIIHKQADWSKGELNTLAETMNDSISYAYQMLNGRRSRAAIRYARWRVRKELFV